MAVHDNLLVVRVVGPYFQDNVDLTFVVTQIVIHLEIMVTEV